ncbi:MAG: dTMP kinase [Wolinella sp.]
MKNLYVAIEGIDTCGKSTQIALLRERFPEAIFTKEPGGSVLGEKLREILLHGEARSARAEMLLFLADRAEHAESVLKNREESLLFSDRSLVSGIAYASGFEMDWLVELNLFAVCGIVPDLVVILELTQDELERRISQKSRDTIESRGVEYLMELQERIKEASSTLKIATLVIDASKSPGEICEIIASSVRGV